MAHYTKFTNLRVTGDLDANLSGTSTIVTATGGTTATSLAARFGYLLNLITDFGCAADGVTDDTSKIQAALNTGKPLYAPAGTYLVTGLSLLTNSRLIGAGYSTIFKLKAAANTSVFTGANTNDVYLADFKIDGNKTNQTDGVISRGVYYNGGGIRQTAHRVWLDAIKDHGFANSVSSGNYSQFIECIATNCGSAAHLAAGGTGGTGFACGGTGVRIIRCNASGNYLNGFKAVGAHHDNCISDSNSSGYETGFGAPDTYYTTYVNCHAWNNTGGGMNHQGQGDSIAILGGSFENNALSGVRFVGDVARARVIGARFKNNGGNGGAIGPRTNDSIGPDAIGIYTNSAAPDGIVIDECEFIIDDGYATTDRYAIYIENTPGIVQIGKRNQSTGYDQAVYITDYIKTVELEGFPGFSGHYALTTPYVHTGTTATTDLASRTVKFHELIGRKLRLTAHGTVTGTAGTKIVRVAFGGSSVVVINQIAAETQQWSIEANITSISTPEIRAVITATEQGGTSSAFPLRAAPGSVDVAFSVNCTLGSAADTVTLTDFRLRTIE